MKKNTPQIFCLGLVLACIWLIGCSGEQSKEQNMANDPEFRSSLEDIRILHETDIAASKESNFEVLRTLVSDDAVILPAGSQVLQGKSQIDDWFFQMKVAMQNFEILEYSMDFQDLQVQGNYAFEWGYTTGAMRNIQTGETQRVTYKIFRVLRKENGEWKVYRSIWNQ
jgi:ketosteroid isomerase-like protein